MPYDKTPRQLTIAVTDRCNLNCWICQRGYYKSLIGNKEQDLHMDRLVKLEKPIRHAEIISLAGFGGYAPAPWLSTLNRFEPVVMSTRE